MRVRHPLFAVALSLLFLLPGSSAHAAAGGPDAAGYTWRDNFDGCSAGTPTFGPGANTILATTAMSPGIPLGFTMPFYGQPVDTVYISPYGYVSFSPGQPNNGNQVALPDGGAPLNMIAVNWAAIDDADLTYEAQGDRFVIRWDQRLSVATYQPHLILERDGTFRMSFNGNIFVDCTVGYQNADASVGHTLLKREGFVYPIRDNGFTEPFNGRGACIFPPVLLDCSSPIMLGCDETVASSLPGSGATSASFFACTDTIYQGDEQLFQLDLTDFRQVSVSIDNPAFDLLMLDPANCQESGCIAQADPAQDRFDFPLFPGTYTFVVDSTDPAASGNFNFDVTCVDPFQPASCDDTLSGDTSAGVSVIDVYACVAPVLDGPEAFFRLDVPTDGPFAVSLNTANPDLWVVIMDPTLTTCLAGGRGGAAVPFAAAGEYALVVDGQNGAGAAFDIEITCGVQLDCSAPATASCAQRVSGDTSTGNDGAVFYNCGTEVFTGREDVYRFFNPVDQGISISFTSSQPGQTLLLLSDCTEGECLLLDDITVACALFPAGEYYIVVDGPPSSEGPYEFEIACSQFLAGLDLRVTGLDTSSLVGSCEDFDVAGTVEVVVSNLGQAPAPAPFDVVVFEDDPTNTNGMYDPATDNVLGTATVMTDIAAGESVFVPVNATGTLQFRDNVLYGIVDPTGVVVADPDPSNNIWDTGRACEFRPPIGEFSPGEEWIWSGSTTLPTFVHVDTVPLVGDINADGVPDVVAPMGPNPGGFGEGVVRVLDGATGNEIWTSTDAATRVFVSTNIALADLDGDPGLEVVGQSNVNTSTLVAIDDDGTLLWTSAPFTDQPGPGGFGGNGGGAPSIADINCDGLPEVIYGAEVFNGNDGTLFWTPQTGGTKGINGAAGGQDGALSVVVDLDGDGQLEVVAGSTAYEWDGMTTGVIRWQNPAVPDGYGAVGNFDSDAGPEIAITADGVIYVIDGADGSLLWQRAIPQGGGGCFSNGTSGGPPTVADFDGDCEAEVGVAGSDLYSVLETDGTVRWSSNINDCSSHRTASSVFDFDGDGAAEVAFMDQTLLHIFSGFDGTEITTRPTDSHTWTEMISIADVDADNNAEIIMPLNGGAMLDRDGDGVGDTPGQGIWVIGDVDDNWVNTRRIWNQHAYHINHVNDDGTVPAAGECEEESWLAHGTYRDQIGTAIYVAPDATISITTLEIISDGDCGSLVRIVARVGNGGAINFGSTIFASFYDGPPVGGLLLDNVEIADLQPGEFEDYEIILPAPRFGQIDIYAVADDDGSGMGTGAINECREDNNECVATVDNSDTGGPGDPAEPVGPALRVGMHGDPYAPNITAVLDWTLDFGTREMGDHYHVLRATDPSTFAFAPNVVGEGYDMLTWEDSTPQAFLHFYRIVAANRCEQEADEREP